MSQGSAEQGTPADVPGPSSTAPPPAPQGTGAAATGGPRHRRHGKSADGAGESPWRRGLRRLLLLAVVVAAGVALAQGPRTCGEVVAQTEVVTVCQPLTATSPEVLLTLLVIGLLLLPELSELEIGGVLKLKRAVEAARTDATEARTEAARATLLATQLATQTTTQHASQVVNNVFDAKALATALAALGVPDALAPEAPDAAAGWLAFQAGFLGLRHLLPGVDPDDIEMLGLTWRADRSGFEPTHDPDEVRPEWAELAYDRLRIMLDERQFPELPVPAVFYDLPTAGGPLGVAAACAPDGGVVGGLLVSVNYRSTKLDPGADEVLREHLPALAAAYAQLLMSLLGETPVQV